MSDSDDRVSRDSVPAAHLDIEVLDPTLEALHLKVTDILSVARENDLLGIAGYEVAFAEGRDPFPDAEVAVYMDVITPFLVSAVPAPARLLDIGAGTGRFAIPLAKQGYSVDLLEPSMSGLLLAQHKAAAESLTDRLRWFCGSSDTMSKLPSKGYDVCLAIQSALYLESIEPFLHELCRVAKRAICFDVPSKYGVMLSGLRGHGASPDNLLRFYQEGRIPRTKSQSLREDPYRAYTYHELVEYLSALPVEAIMIQPLLFAETMNVPQHHYGNPETLELERRCRQNPDMRDMGAFYIVTAQVLP